MPYYEVVNLVTVTKTNMIDEMPCAYGTLRMASGPIYIPLLNPMNLFPRMVTVGHNATVFIYNRIPTKREETAKPRSEGDMQRHVSYWCRALSSLPPGCLWRHWRSASTLTEMVFADGSFSQWESDRVAICFVNTDCQHIGFSLQWPIQYSITVLIRPTIVDAPLTLILM